MSYPKRKYPWHEKWHYPDCANPVGEDNDCPHCMVFRILDQRVIDAKEQERMEKWDKHANGWQQYQCKNATIDKVYDKYYNPKSEIINRSMYRKAVLEFNRTLKAWIKEVDDYWTQVNNHNDLMDIDQEKTIKEADLNDLPIRTDQKEILQDMDIDQNNSIIVQIEGVAITLSWDDKGITFDNNRHEWPEVKRWQVKIGRRNTSPIRFRHWKGPFATCWCILNESSRHKILDDNQECSECEYWITVIHSLSKLPDNVRKPLNESKKLYPWYEPLEKTERLRAWQCPNLTEKFEVQTLSKSAIIPYKAYAKDAAWDIYAAEDCKPNEYGVVVVPTHIKIRYAKGHYGQLKTKSSQALKGLSVLGGILDEGYEGEIKVILQKPGDDKFEVKKGEKVAQIIIYEQVDKPTEEAPHEKRGIKGFGSSGKWAKNLKTSDKHEERLKKIFNIVKSQGKEINDEQKAQLSKLLAKHASTFVENSNDIHTTVEGFHHYIKLMDDTPICEANRHMSPIKKAFLKEELEKMKEKGVISECPHSIPWGFQVVIVKKKDGTLRLCVDYRKLNQVTVKDKYPLPKIQELIDRVGKAKYFTSLDLASGYWQVPMYEAHKQYTTFVCPYGQFYFNVMPFGLTNAPATFQRMMDRILNELREDFCEVYLDDILIYSETFEQHLIHIEKIIQRLNKYGLKLKHKKCHFAQLETEYLGFILSDGGYKTSPRIIEAIQKFPEPKLNQPVPLQTLQSYLGLCNFYRKFIKNYNEIYDPMNELLPQQIKVVKPYVGENKRKKWEITFKNNPRTWTERQSVAFNKMKEAFQKTLEEGGTRLAYPIPGRSFIIRTDASKIGLGAALLQYTEEGIELPIMYAHRVLNSAEKNYGATDLEGLVVKEAIKEWFRPYVWGQHFKIYTDHQPLLSAFRNRDIDGRLGGWINELSEFTFTLVHQPGKKNYLADVLSRIPPQNAHDDEEYVHIMLLQFKISDTEFQMKGTVLRN